ncbi:hypothetical protein [Celeribacter neptunius]|uniref:PH domain-containing protein n=1 Tax=Celeribacter neptunius TaxID=588602 RepID=A0A1I3INE8_9RHOB|nr:hypothetical protein [Celeribacter neptunius]SFI49293.1 hypothetical protein SAMN04487991_0075 [Celeribacter neptunius]
MTELNASDLTLTPSPARRFSAAAMLVLLALILVWVVSRPEGLGLGWSAMLVAMAAGALFLAWKLWVVTGQRLILTEDELRQENGPVLCRIEDVAGVERGTFAFKPSNGFVIRLKTRAPRGWAPGLWWRLGKRIGVGGVTPAGQGKAMADVIAARVAGMGRID